MGYLSTRSRIQTVYAQFFGFLKLLWKPMGIHSPFSIENEWRAQLNILDTVGSS